MSIVDCTHHAEVRTHTKRKLQLHCQLQAAHILAASAASLLISFFIHRSICRISTCVYIVDVHKYIDWFWSMIYLSPPFSKDKTPHVSGSWPQTRAWYKSFDGYGHLCGYHSAFLRRKNKCNIKWFADFGEYEANFWMSEWLANIQRNQMNHDSVFVTILFWFVYFSSLGVKQARQSSLRLSWEHYLELVECISKTCHT